MTADLTPATHALDAAIVMELLPTRPRLFALGEPTHGQDALLEVRNDLFRQLVEQEGYRTITVESDCMMGLVVDDYLASRTGTLDEVMARGFSHEWGAFAGNRELVRWMRAYNDGRPASERLRFAGFDGPLEITAAASPRQSLGALHTYLAAHMEADLLPYTTETLDRLLGADDQWTNEAAMMDPAQSVGRTPEAAQLRLLADDLSALLDTQLPHLIAVSSHEELDRARLYARTATGLLRYHHAMADASPSRMTRLCALRDVMMAANLLALAEQGPTLVFAHNSHLQRTRSSMQMWSGPVQWWGAGSIVSARLGEQYAFMATAVGTIRDHAVENPPSDTVEGLLYALPQDRCLVDTRQLAATLGDATPAPRVSPWYGYAPLDPAQLATTDGLVFVKEA